MSKIVIIFIIACAFQGFQAQGLGEIINQIREIIGGLNELSTGRIAAVIKQDSSIISETQSALESVLSAGVSSISTITPTIVDISKEATELGIDVTVCLSGREDQIEELTEQLQKNVTGIGNTAISSYVKDIQIVNDINQQIIRIIGRVPKALISLRPLKTLTEILNEATDLLKDIPNRLLEIQSSLNKVNEEFISRSNEILLNVDVEAKKITEDVTSCVNNLIEGNNDGLSIL